QVCHLELGQVEMAHLAAGVDPGIGAPGDRHLHARARHAREARLELALDGALTGLGGPAVEVGAVVGEVQAQPGGRLSRRVSGVRELCRHASDRSPTALRPRGPPLGHFPGRGRAPVSLARVKILVIGSGGREHAIIRRLAADRPAPELHAAPGNPGIAQPATCHDVAAADPAGLLPLPDELRPDLVVIGPEAPLVAGAADRLREAGHTVFGPSAEAANLEGSKSWAKEIMAAAGVPTAASVTVTAPEQLGAGLDRVNPLGDVPFVVKADGLAAGKGVVVTPARDVAVAHAEAVLASGGQVVLEEYLDGPEVSLFCVSDGTRVLPLAPAQDFKRALDGDEGPNTGGMGAYSPLPWAPEGLVREVVTAVAQPTIDELAARGIPFSGILYCGLALTSRGLRVVEFNARFGDPETQVVLERLASPFA